MKFINSISPRLLSVFDAGLIIVISSVYAKTAAAVNSGIPAEARVPIALFSILPLVIFFFTALLCFTGKRKGLIFALLLSSVMALFAITYTGAGGFILIFLDGAEAGVNATFDALYYSSFFMAGGGLLLLLYMLVHILILFRTVKRIS
ncbi:MAG TPA: hypothetical protein PK358_12920 [Spirochaetota bacterium]|nr:hypothetical protein [Spirochaetota bacterium]HPJ35732.1 hypothetical protein [Spirochaetota bacterium]